MMRNLQVSIYLKVALHMKWKILKYMLQIIIFCGIIQRFISLVVLQCSLQYLKFNIHQLIQEPSKWWVLSVSLSYENK